ncbi:pyridine nucleotide-disulfide oxidoreductase/dicluster-binding protein [Desulfomonile tiedjei]|uniref:NADPH-dependent glutamate synthase beta chain-like oxidoreductase n=1 Tax=Desulfomonile tiedjei (strain ATCC 49306 / DSM 6799 / DCB-1) TaxID=706587 RepID=I4C4L5_DESTA|nr:pyridine nucleotide-disulfide oxidoreductase/dicluster-binding protein [Desulfomonile tiedjei]AFM24506.1 NADPH-dependent glutamate synthase beta chain-like oxidoreductase [Desulfomonile tiedjei DSM 6799]
MDQQELRELESRCIQECAPWCSAACPVHVDVRAMNAAIAKGDFAAALKIFTKSVPFPGIISRVCDHPCQDSCKRGDAGSTISIRALERAAFAQAPVTKARVTPLPRKDKRVAVVGGGLSGLTASLDLAKKGYQIVLFEATDRLGGSLWDYPETELPREAILRDFDILADLSVEIRLKTSVGQDIPLSDLQKEFDAVYLGSGFGSRNEGELNVTADALVPVTQETFETNEPGVFAGGTLVRGAKERSPIRSISDGRRTAISIDRFLQKVSLTASRENEGSYETRLYTSLEGIEALPEVPLSNAPEGYSAEEAVQEAKRCLQCECMECVKVCEFLASFKGYPKKYIRQIYNNLSIVMGQRHGNKLINSCSNCGLCKEVCPEDLHMGEICIAARETMVEQGKMPPSAHEFALRDMEFSNSDKFALHRHQPGMDSSRFLFFPGCQLCASSPINVKRTYSYLAERLTGGVGLMLRCCGAPADWAGRKEEFARVVSGFEAQWLEMGKPELIVACSTCYSVFKAHLPHVKVQSLWETIDTLGLPDVPRMETFAVAVHDPCTSRHHDSIQDSVRNILRRLGYEIHELPLSRNTTECCGFGGLMYFANRELAEKTVRRRISESPLQYLAYCAMCRDQFSFEGKPAWHLLDFIFGPGDFEHAAQKGPDYSQRRENRARLKHSLLKDLWGEDVAEGRQPVKLQISEQVRDLMERRMILTEDIQEIIEWAERTGFKLVNSHSGHFLAHHTPTTVTYWVEYSPAEDGFVVHNAYSHRMEIMEELKP